MSFVARVCRDPRRVYNKNNFSTEIGGLAENPISVCYSSLRRPSMNP